MGNRNGESGRCTHALQEVLAPSLFWPRQLRRTLETDEEFALEVEKLVQVGKEEMYRVLVNDIALGKSSGVFLRDWRDWR